MLEYFAYKKVKKHRAQKARAEVEAPSPVLTKEDENFLGRIVSAEGTPPPLPERPRFGPEAGDPTNNPSQMVVHDGRTDHIEEPGIQGKGKGGGNEKPKDRPKEKEKGPKKSNRFSFLHKSSTKRDKKQDGLKPNDNVEPDEASKEEDDINRVLDNLNLAAVNNRAFSISKESQELVQKFTVILKDLINGVPTAYDDLTHLLDDSQGTLAKSYDHLPSFLQKLIKQLPTKISSTLAPELLAVATEAQAFDTAAAASAGGGLAGAAKNFLRPSSLKDLVKKPGAVASLLKAILNALKLRWPAFMGTNVLLSLALFVLLFVFWYCHKRGREVRLEKARIVDSEGRVTELEDDAMLENRVETQSHSSDRDRDQEQQHRDRDHDHERDRNGREKTNSRS
ncbi:hypothetical protein B7494_g4518 [Chlorociboria aeruginascens]|nr:hypothetical protein B7494_g4518 [Chlorociboria aeruginascens]